MFRTGSVWGEFDPRKSEYKSDWLIIDAGCGRAVTRRLRRARPPRGIEYWLIDEASDSLVLTPGAVYTKANTDLVGNPISERELTLAEVAALFRVDPKTVTRRRSGIRRPAAPAMPRKARGRD